MQKYPDGVYRSIIIDTVSALQTNLYTKLLKDKGKAGYDDWKDFGVEILDLYQYLKDNEDTVLVQILGYEGTGKTVGGSFLDPSETIWLNADNKPLTFFGARQKYPVGNEKKNYKVVYNYDEVKKIFNSAHAKRKGTFIVFLLSHIEDYKAAGDIMRQRLKVLGKMATKHSIEGLNLSHTYYTVVDTLMPMDDPMRYKLSTLNSGLNTARSPQGYWPTPEIANNYQTIVDRILEDFGEKEPTAENS